MTLTPRLSLYRCFVDRFRPPSSRCHVTAVTDGDIDAAEAAIGRKLPTSYRTLVTQFGAGDIELPDDTRFWLHEIWSPDWIVRQVQDAWSAPIPSFLTGGAPLTSDVAWNHLTPFGSERMHGYWFCFRREPASVDDSPVFYFNHDGGDIEQIADGLDDLLQQLSSAAQT